jgi:ABC-2 type transport system ATP-binding protein
MQLIFPTTGHAWILDRPAGDVAMRRRIGYLPENPTFYDNVSAEELLGYFASLFGYRGAERSRRVAALLDEVGLGPERRMQLRKYSKGMIQRVGLAQALVNDPEVVFLDEPMSGLDPIGRRDVRDIILRLRDRGATVFFSSHILGDAESMCSRVGIVAGGTLVASGALVEMVPFRIRGWDLVLAGVTADAAAALSARAAAATLIGDGRYHVVLPASASSEDAVALAKSANAELVSVNPIRDTLEDFFLARVQKSAGRSFD